MAKKRIRTEYLRNWRKNNRDKDREYSKKWREGHKEYYKKYCKEWYFKNIERAKKTNKLWRNEKKFVIYPEFIEIKKRLQKVAHTIRQNIYNKKNKKHLQLKKYEWEKTKYKTDKEFNIKKRLRRNLRQALNHYSKTGKIYNSKKYGVNYKEIIEHLEPFPEDVSKYHIDHIKPLCLFNFNNLEEVKKAFAPENHQWLTIEENLKKGSDYK